MANGTVTIRISEVVASQLQPTDPRPSGRVLALFLDHAIVLAAAAATPWSKIIDVDRDQDWTDALTDANNRVTSALHLLLPGRYRLNAQPETYKPVYDPVTNQIIGHISSSSIVDDDSGQVHESKTELYGTLVGSVTVLISQ